MPRKIKIIKEEAVEEEENFSIEKPVEEPEEKIEMVKPKKERKPRKKIEKVVEEEKIIPKEPVYIDLDQMKRKKGRPALTEEEKELKQQIKKQLKEEKLKEQMEKINKKYEIQAQKKAKKKIIEEIKANLTDTEDEDLSLSDDEEIQKILKHKKKPIVIINKIPNQPKKKSSNNDNGVEVVFC